MSDPTPTTAEAPDEVTAIFDQMINCLKILGRIRTIMANAAVWRRDDLAKSAEDTLMELIKLNLAYQALVREGDATEEEGQTALQAVDRSIAVHGEIIDRLRATPSVTVHADGSTGAPPLPDLTPPPDSV